MVSNIYPAGSSEPVFQTQIPLNPGSSGGPIVDRNGAVVGIVTAGLVNDQRGQAPLIAFIFKQLTIPKHR